MSIRDWAPKTAAFLAVLLVVWVALAEWRSVPSAPVLFREFELTDEQVAAAGNVVVFVLDSAVDERFLQGRTLDMKADEVTHGSLVARVIRSYCRAPLVSIVAEDAAGAADHDAYVDGLSAVLAYARAHPGVHVLANVSLGSYERDPQEQDLIRQLVRAGVLVVAAVGNDDAQDPLYPAAYPGVVAVASAEEDGKAPASNYGPHVAISASGDIGFIDYEFLPYERLRREMEARGTSFAAPRVTATLAYILQKRPELSPRKAFDVVVRTATPIRDGYFETGKLGAGLLDIYAAKSSVHPPYRWLQYGLPAALGLMLVALSVALCVRYALVGLFVSLLIWMVGVPSGMLIGVGTKRYLEFIGAGYRDAGPVPFVMAGAGVLGCAIAVRFDARRLVGVCLPPAGLGFALGLAGAEPVLGAVTFLAASLGLAAWAELRMRRLLARIRSMPGELPVEEAAAFLARAYERSGDGRVRLAAKETVLRLPLKDAARHLLAGRLHPRGAAALLEEIERHVEQQPAGEGAASVGDRPALPPRQGKGGTGGRAL